jgi:hypothetical protein
MILTDLAPNTVGHLETPHMTMIILRMGDISGVNTRNRWEAR